jgi:hypothetical protein
MSLTGTLAKWRSRLSPIIGALVAMAKQLHLGPFQLIGIVGPHPCD